MKEGIFVRDIINNNNSLRTFVVGGGDCPKPFLTSSIPLN